MTTLKHFYLSLYWFATNLIWGALLGPVLSSQVAVLVPKNSAEALGWMVAFAAIPALVVPLVVGPLSDRCRHPLGRRKPYIAAGGLLTFFGLILMGLAFQAHSFLAYVFCYGVVQIGANTAISAYMAVIPDLVPSDQRGKASAFMAVMANVGTLCGLALAALMKSSAETQTVLAFILVGVLAWFLSNIVEEPFHSELGPIHWLNWLKSLWISPRQFPDFAWVWVTRALMMLGFYTIQPFLLYYLRDIIAVGHPDHDLPGLLGLILFAATVSAFVAGQASDKFGRKALVRISSLTVAAACIAFPRLHSLPAAMVAGLVFGIGYGAYISVDWALGTEVLPDKENAAKDMGVWHIAMVLPQQVGAVLGGSLILSQFHGAVIQFRGESVVSYLPTGYYWLFATGAGFFALSGLLISKVRGVR